MRLVTRLAVICVILMLSMTVVFHPASAQQTPAAESYPADVNLPADDIAALLDGFVPFAIAQARIAGAVVVVVDREGIVFQQGYGLADMDAGRPVISDETLFRPGSISKLFTWTAVMQQVEAGRIDLDADINTYLDFQIPPLDGQPITMRQIMTHTAGFEEALRYLFTAGPMPLEVYVKQSLPARVFVPGTTPAYSNYASALAGYVVVRVSGQPFETYMADNIFAPLDMAKSTFAQPLPEAHAAYMSRRYDAAGWPAQDFQMIVAPAGGLSASGADIGRFMIAHLNDGQGILRPETARMMHAYQAPGIEGLNRMALGFYEKSVNGRRGIGHGGDTQGFHSDLTIFPDEGVGIYISLNSSGVGGESLAIRQLLLEGFADRYLPPEAPQEIVPGVDAATAKEHAALVSGNYISSRGSFTNFLSFAGFLGQIPVGVTAEGKLSFPMLENLGLGAFDWVEIAPFVWQDRHSSQTIAAEVVDGKVVRMSTDVFSPVTVLLPAPPSQDAALWLPLIGMAVFVIMLQALLWPVRRLVRSRLGVPLDLGKVHLTAYRATGFFAWGVVLAVLGWMFFLTAASTDATLLGGAMDGVLNTLRVVLPVSAAGLAVAAFIHMGLSFGGRRSWFAHFGRLLLFLSVLVVLWIIYTHHLYGFDLGF